MKVLRKVVLISVVGCGLWNLLLLRRNYVAHKGDDRSAQYSRRKLAKAQKEQVFDTLTEVLSLRFNIPALLWARCVPTANTYLRTLCFTTVSDTLSTCLALPWKWYSTFRVEEEFGFNKTSPSEFVKDLGKQFFLRNAILSPMVSTLVDGVVRYFGKQFPVYLFLSASALSIAATFVIPSLVLPLFNKFTPLPADSSLSVSIRNLCTKLHFPIGKIYTVDGSRRSAHSNAYFYGFWNNKQIVLFDTLVDQLDEEEVLAVMCHELGHWSLSHTLFQLLLGLGQLGGICAASGKVLFNSNLFDDFGFEAPTPFIRFSLFTSFLPPVFEVISCLTCALSRRFEYQADAFAVNQGYGKQLQSALLKMQKENLISDSPDWLYAACRLSHPTVADRVKRIDQLLGEIESKSL
jgi:STE24 endopeptidase